MFNKSFEIIQKNISLDDENKVSKVKNEFNSIFVSYDSLKNNIENTKISIDKSRELLKIIEQEKKKIELESYNNYKLMANGLITEVLTHELHSLLLDTKDNELYEEHINKIKEYLFEMKEFALNKEHLKPIDSNFKLLYNRMSELNRFYQFLEKTFLYKGTWEDFILED